MKGRYRAGIVGIASELPSKVITNKNLETFLETSDEWIKSRTGIEERRVIEDNLNVSDLAAAASRKAISDAGIEVSDLDMIIATSSSPEMVWPSTACLIQAKLGISSGTAAFDLQAACSGFCYGLSIASNLIENGSYRNILVVGAEAITRYLDWQDRNTCVLFGDAAAAVVVSQVDEGFGIIASYLGADGFGAKLLGVANSGTSALVNDGNSLSKPKIIMNGSEVFKFAVKIIPDSVSKLLEKSNLGLTDIDYLIPHQSNERITYAAADRLGIDRSKVVNDIAKYGNTSTASIPLALDNLYHQGKLIRGSLIALVGFGAGLTWAANLVKWSK